MVRMGAVGGASNANGSHSHHRRSSSFFAQLPDSSNNNSSMDVQKKNVPTSPRATNHHQAVNNFDDFFSKPEGKSFLVQTIVHAADLSSQSLKQEFAEDWGRRITAEFTAQAELERAKQLPISVPVCSTDVDFYKSQVFFIRQIALP